MDQAQEKAKPRRIPKGMEVKTLRAVTLVLMLCGSTVVMLSSASADLLRRGETKLVSQDQMGLPSDGGYSDVSDDGRYVAFESWDRLTPEDTDDLSDVYIRDTVAGTTKLVSPDVPGVSDGLCNHHPSMSADGTKIIYFSAYRTLPLKVHLDRCLQVVLVYRDLTTDVSKRLSLGASGFYPQNARLSGDGSWVLVHKDDNYSDDYVSVINVVTNTLAWTSPALCWGCGVGEPSVSISHTGRFITFRSQRDFVPGDSDADWDIYLHDRDSDQDGAFDEPGAIQTRLANILQDGSSPYSDQGGVSDDGRYLAFLAKMSRTCIANTSICHSTSNLSGLYIRDLVVGSTEFITSTTWTPFVGTASILSGPHGVRIAGDGRYVAFSSDLPLKPGDTNPASDVYYYDRVSRKMSLASILPQQTSGIVNVAHFSMSSNGRYLSFNTDLIGTIDVTDLSRAVYIRDLFAPCPVVCPEDLIP